LLSVAGNPGDNMRKTGKLKAPTEDRQSDRERLHWGRVWR
jgi:hypothetical protein